MQEIPIQVTNVKGARNVSLTLKGIALVAGDNGAAKTSFRKAVGFCVAGIIPKEKPKRQKMLTRGSSNGQIVVGGSSIDLPNDESITTTGHPKASKYAAGLVRFSEESPAVISIFLQKLLKTEPTQEDFSAVLTPLKVSQAVQEAVWSRIEKSGWTDAHKFYEQRGKDMKTEWRLLASNGQSWGSVQSAKFLPKDWEPELDGKSEKTLMEELAQQKETLEGMVAYEAVDEERVAKLQEQYMGLEDKKAAFAEKKAELDSAEATLKAANLVLRNLPRPGQPVKTHACVECHTEHIFVNGALVKAPPPVVEDTEALLKAIKEAEHDASIKGQLYAAAEAAHRLADLEVYNAKNAHEEYLKLQARPKQEKPDPLKLEKQRTAVERSEKRLKAFKQKEAADLKHQSIIDNQVIIDALAPDGFRQTHSAAAIAKFNQEYLIDQCAIAGWKPVRLDKNLNITFDNEDYIDLSTGEQFRVNACFQIALARLMHDDILLFDDAECLDPNGAKGLFQLLATVGIPAIVCMRQRQNLVPDLQAMGIGESYWLENGTMHPLKEAVTA